MYAGSCINACSRPTSCYNINTINAYLFAGRTFGTEVGSIDGSFYASSGNITSPNHPETYPDEYGVYHWTIVSKEGSLVFQFTAFDTNQKRPDCRGNSGVAIYCGMDIPPLQPWVIFSLSEIKCLDTLNLAKRTTIWSATRGSWVFINMINTS